MAVSAKYVVEVDYRILRLQVRNMRLLLGVGSYWKKSEVLCDKFRY